MSEPVIPSDQTAAEPAPATSVDSSLSGKERTKPRRRPLLYGLIGAVLVIALIAVLITVTRKPASVAAAPSGPAVNSSATLTVGLTLEPTNLDIRKTAGAALDQILIDNVYRPLVSRTTDGTIKPSVASEWKISSDALTYTFTIPAGQSFSNGTAITAKTAAASIQSVIDSKFSGSEYLGSVATVASTSDTQLVVTLSKPYPDLLWALSGRAGLVLDTTATNDRTTTAIGSGPFTLSEWKKGDSITLARNDTFTGTKAGVAKVVFRYITDTNAAVNALKAGDIDVLAPIDTILSQQLPTDKFSVTKGTASDKFVLAFNNARAPFTDIKVRQAIRYAIDHEAIVKARGGVDGLLGGPIPDVDPGYEDLTGLYPHDVAKAKQLLADAGFAKGLTLTLTIPSFYGTTLSNLLTSQLAEAGITLKVNSVEFATWLQQVYTNHDYDLSIVDHAEGHDFGLWSNAKYYFGYNNGQVQALYAQAQTATSVDQQKTLLAQAAKIVSQDAAADWLVNFRTVTAIRTGVTGFPTDQINNRLNVSAVTVAS
jgi:peptide/nickel transport system substrate-binding protein